MFLRRLWHAMSLTAVTVAWIWKRFLGRGYDHNFTLSFTVCYHCDERFALPGLVYCRHCLDWYTAHWDDEQQEQTGAE
jgi:hypothetical protein